MAKIRRSCRLGSDRAPPRIDRPSFCRGACAGSRHRRSITGEREYRANLGRPQVIPAEMRVVPCGYSWAPISARPQSGRIGFEDTRGVAWFCIFPRLAENAGKVGSKFSRSVSCRSQQVCARNPHGCRAEGRARAATRCGVCPCLVMRGGLQGRYQIGEDHARSCSVKGSPVVAGSMPNANASNN